MTVRDTHQRHFDALSAEIEELNGSILDLVHERAVEAAWLAAFREAA